MTAGRCDRAAVCRSAWRDYSGPPDCHASSFDLCLAATASLRRARQHTLRAGPPRGKVRSRTRAHRRTAVHQVVVDVLHSLTLNAAKTKALTLEKCQHRRCPKSFSEYGPGRRGAVSGRRTRSPSTNCGLLNRPLPRAGRFR